MKKKALHLLNYFRQGGAENVALNYSRVLSDVGIENIVYGKTDNISYESRFKETCETINKLQKSDLKVDYIFVHSNQGLLRLLKYYRFLKKNKIRVIYIQHLEYPENKFRMLSKLINLICTDFIQITPITKKLVDKYIVIDTHFIVNFYINKYSDRERKLLRKQLREEFGFSSEDLVISYSAIFKPGKNVSEFIDLADEMKDDKNFKFLLIGDGPENECVKNYSYDNLIWVGRQNDVEKYLLAADFYTFLSRKEMMPMALIEALSVDLKCIGYDNEFNRFLLKNNVCNKLNRDAILDFANCINRIENKKNSKYDYQYAMDTFRKLFL